MRGPRPLAFVAGTTYHAAFVLTDYMMDTLTPRLTGGTAVSAVAVTGTGRGQDQLTGLSGNTGFALYATSTFDGSVYDAILYL